MNNSIDIIGLANIVKYIEVSGKSKFTIYRAGQNGMNIPVFECDQTQTNGNAVREFERWAEVINNAVIYKIVLFNVCHLDTDEMGNTTTKKTKQKSNKMEALFAINEPGSYSKIGSDSKGFDIEKEMAIYKREVDFEYKKKEEENKILATLDKINERMTILEAREAELDEEEEEEDGIGGLSPAKIKDMMALIALFKGGQPQQTAPVLNGNADIEEAKTIDEKKIKINNINNAVKRLFVHDKQLDTDLLLLAEMAEKDSGTFNMLLGMLRNK
jgi:hypothetical protein